VHLDPRTTREVKDTRVVLERWFFSNPKDMEVLIIQRGFFSKMEALTTMEGCSPRWRDPIRGGR
jgi:hypothetical protein